jgi:regulator of protease activity HflC (stomatin/prohibitin superfamily)
VARDADDVLYLAVQMAAREAVTSRTLDELLEGRDALASEIATAVKARAEAVGLKVSGVGIRDLVLPGDMKVLLNKVIEARKQAEANVILRREEAAATRALGQTAELLSEQPVLMRLKELEAYKDLAGSVGQVNLVVGEGGLDLMKLANGVSR